MGYYIERFIVVAILKPLLVVTLLLVKAAVLTLDAITALSNKITGGK